ncbi:YolD-like family protein [Schinkia azotoformans]|uniref:YolD-like family protein n=1 Tax=Schinkia azotoformans TaxID=1454 RepID=UPI002DB79586|nr:YolD-like family protein [Schinkia azotoformans]MEC1714778.1 YolD-like family protein [Schinkia azotoformans]MEC1757466.1 YolD-like family protein [Schinkia azotoformans]
MIKDRGTKKWVAMMLPEHVGMVKQSWKDAEKLPKPILDEQALEEIERSILEANETKSELIITYWENGAFKNIIGHVHSIITHQKAIRIEDKFEMRHTVKFSDIIDIRLN